MSIRKFRAARVTTTNANVYVGQHGDIFYDETLGQLKISDGSTPGGSLVFGAATSTKLGGIKAGPGAVVGSDGLLTIDTSGLPLNIGDLAITQANISTVNGNEDLNLITNGTGNVNLIGNIRVQTTSAGLYSTPVFNVDNHGNLTVNGNLITNGGTYLVGTTTFIGPTVHQGNLVTNGNLITNGASYFNGNVTEVGNLNVVGNAINNGNTVFNGNVQTNGILTITGNTNMVGNVVQQGNLTITGTTVNNGLSIFNGNLNITGNTTQTGNLTITGTSINNGLSVFNGNLTITGNAALAGNTTITGNTLVTGNTNVIGTTFLTGNSYVTGNTFVTGTTTVAGNTYVTGMVTTITGNTYLQGNSFVTGTTTVTGNITVTGNSVQTGPATFIVTMNSSNQGAVEITGNTLGLSQPPQNSGVMLHTTGPDGDATSGRAYFDSGGNYTVIAGRRYNGTIANPTQVLANQDIVRWGGTAYATGGWPTIGPSRISYVTNEDFTSTNQGGRIEFWTTANGTVASTNISRTATIDPALGVTATGFVTAGNVTAGNVIATTYYGNIVGTTSTLTGNITAGNVIATTHYGNIVGTTSTLTGNITAGNLVTTGNTYAGNVIVSGNETVTGNVTAANVNATLHGNVVGVATGLATAGTNFAGTFLTGQLSISPGLIAKTSASTQTFTITGLTTSHKIVISPANDLTYGIYITAAYASATSTVSIQFQNTTNGGVTPATMNINYFAWI